MTMQSQSVTTPFFRVGQVATRLDISIPTVWNRCNPKSRQYDPNFPKPIKVSCNSTRWLESEINDYITHLASNRKQGA